MVASGVPPAGDLACNPGMCPDGESNRRPFGLQVGAQSTEPQQPGLSDLSLSHIKFMCNTPRLCINSIIDLKSIKGILFYFYCLPHSALGYGNVDPELLDVYLLPKVPLLGIISVPC